MMFCVDLNKPGKRIRQTAVRDELGILNLASAQGDGLDELLRSCSALHF